MMETVNKNKFSQFDLDKKRPICEIYPCLQSEGKYTGIPHLLIRTTGCPLRCQFSNTDFCDSFYTSWSPEKGKFCYRDLIDLILKYPHIKHSMVTGGSPTLNSTVLQEICNILKLFGHYITIETEGSKYVETSADFISLSPKLASSTPRVGTIAPNSKIVTQKQADNHNKKRKNFKAMEDLISLHPDYQLKPVISEISDMEEVKEIQEILGIPNSMVYLMPAGGTEKDLQGKRGWLMEYCWKEGYNYTDRIHITAYGDKRGY